jgi:hypothetical protein
MFLLTGGVPARRIVVTADLCAKLVEKGRRLVAEGIDPREHRRQLQAAAAVQPPRS